MVSLTTVRCLSKYQLPDNLQGCRILDIGAFDGFWSFEFEKRGASEVIALDLEHFRIVQG